MWVSVQGIVMGAAVISVLEVAAWTCVALFVVTSIVTILALLGIVRLGGGDGTHHQYFLRRLFAALLIEVIAASVASYGGLLTGLVGPFQNSEKVVSDLSTRVKALEDAAANPNQPSISTNWELVRTGDCEGSDVGSSGGPLPQEAMCSDAGLMAVCWDGTTYRNGDTAWCTYKRKDINQCGGGKATGLLYSCRPKA